jgi:indolepyruvate ferredoxin oxidoreductase beta subunit
MTAIRKQDIILAGVGGQGILSIAFVIDHAALKEGFNVKQAEVHGMAQRGGAVQSHLRLSKDQIWSDLIPRGEADMILSVVTSSTPFVNIPDYPDQEKLIGRIRKIPGSVIVDSEALAKEAGTSKVQNTVMLGAAAKDLVVNEDSLLESIKILFAPRGDKVLEANISAFELGRKAAG